MSTRISAENEQVVFQGRGPLDDEGTMGKWVDIDVKPEEMSLVDFIEIECRNTAWIHFSGHEWRVVKRVEIPIDWKGCEW